MLNKKKQQFMAKVSKQGEKIIIIVPMQNHKDVKSLMGKTVRVTLEDLIE